MCCVSHPSYAPSSNVQYCVKGRETVGNLKVFGEVNIRGMIMPCSYIDKYKCFCGTHSLCLHQHTSLTH